MINWRKAPLLILAYFSIGIGYAATTKEQLADRLKNAATAGNYLQVAMDYVGKDGMNFIITFIVVTAALYVGLGLVEQFQNAGDAVKIGTKIFAVAAGLAAAYYALMNKIYVIDLLGRASLLVFIVVIGLVFYNVLNVARERGKLSWLGLGVAMIISGIAAMVLLKSWSWSWLLTIFLILGGMLIFIIGAAMGVHGLFESKTKRGIEDSAGETNKAESAAESVVKELKEGKKDIQVAQKLEAREGGLVATQQANALQAEQAAQQGDWKAVKTHLEQAVKEYPAEQRIRTKIMKNVAKGIKHIEKVKTQLTDQENHLQKGIEGLEKVLSETKEYLNSPPKKILDNIRTARTLLGQLKDIRNSSIKELESIAVEIRNYEKFSLGKERQILGVLKEAILAIGKGDPSAPDKVGKAFNLDRAARAWERTLRQMESKLIEHMQSAAERLTVIKNAEKGLFEVEKQSAHGKTLLAP